ncbi:MAG: hypothetical protein V1903_13680 [Bacteroidota bacterium]
MSSDEMKYERLLDILRKSKPVLQSPDMLKDKVVDRILSTQGKKEPSPGILDFLFGWVYIGWVRRGLIAASAAMVLVFVYQQGVIIKRINTLNRQAVFIEGQIITGNSNNTDAAFLYRLAGRNIPAGEIKISERQMKRMIRSYNELEEKYRDLVNLIEGDPALKKYVEEQLSVKHKGKLNL